RSLLAWTAGDAGVTVAGDLRGSGMLFDLETVGTENAYKLLVATVAPRPIAWVSTRDLDGSINAAPFSFFNVMSGKPPIVCIGIGGRGPGDAKDTGNIIRRTGDFVVNLVDRARVEAMVVTAIEFAPEVDEFK